MKILEKILPMVAVTVLVASLVSVVLVAIKYFVPAAQFMVDEKVISEIVARQENLITPPDSCVEWGSHDVRETELEGAEALDSAPVWWSEATNDLCGMLETDVIASRVSAWLSFDRDVWEHGLDLVKGDAHEFKTAEITKCNGEVCQTELMAIVDDTYLGNGLNLVIYIRVKTDGFDDAGTPRAKLIAHSYVDSYFWPLARDLKNNTSR